jgi:meso-butanediol dehydrogenase/(S,S)-butanediol dehydrogenase/diacetyl reductase
MRRGPSETEQLVSKGGGRTLSYAPADVWDPSAAAQWVEDGVAAAGGIDIVYNNAALARARTMESTSIEDWEFTLHHEIDPLFHVTRAAWPHLLARGGGSIINIASVSALRPSVGWVAHPAAKGAVISFSRCKYRVGWWPV